MKKKKLRGKINILVETRYGTQLCVLEPDEKRGFIVTAPGLDGIITWGKNITHAKEMAREAIELCIEARAEESLQQAKKNRRGVVREPIAV